LANGLYTEYYLFEMLYPMNMSGVAVYYCFFGVSFGTCMKANHPNTLRYFNDGFFPDPCETWYGVLPTPDSVRMWFLRLTATGTA
jgi:hypothetical protein